MAMDTISVLIADDHPLYCEGLRMCLEQDELEVVGIANNGRHLNQPGQSLVELCIFLPIFLAMLALLVEVGFLVHNYLTLVDAAREGARWGVPGDPFDDTDFYRDISRTYTLENMFSITPDASEIDIVVSVFSLTTPSGGDPTVTTRYPDDDGWSLNEEGGRGGGGDKKPSAFSIADINTRLQGMAGSPSTGVVLVEVFYEHFQALNLPLVSQISALNPLSLHVYTFMPMKKAAP
jgi:hypothetical protein